MMSLKNALGTIAAVIVLGLTPALAQSGDYDLIIRGGRIVDGTGNPAFNGDVAVKDGRIAAVGQLGTARAGRTIDARNRIVAPGFIDLHTHGDVTLLADGRGESRVRDGVTLEVIGEKSTVAPRDGLKPQTEDGVQVNWTTFTQYFSRIEEQGISLNLLTFVSSDQIRSVVMGPDNPRPATPAQLDQMKKLMARSMEEGAAGLVTRFESGGPPYPEEVIELAKIAASYGGTYNSHIGSEGNEQEKELAFAIRVAEEAAVPVEIYHLKIRGNPLWGTIGKYIKQVEDARARGLDITANQYPYTAMHHGWSAFFPVWVREGGTEAFGRRLKDPKVRARIKADKDFATWVEEHGGWDGIHLGRTQSAQHKQYEGKSVTEIARLRGDKDPADAVITIMADDGGRTSGIFVNMSEDDVRMIMRQPWVAVGSDGAAINVDAPGVPHARSFSTQSRILGHYVREEGVLTLEDAVRKMTSLPAQILRLQDHGRIEKGYVADIVVFDPKTVGATNTLERPKSYSKGFDAVIVNGVTVVEKDQHTGARPGRVLFGPGHSAR